MHPRSIIKACKGVGGGSKIDSYRPRSAECDGKSKTCIKKQTHAAEWCRIKGGSYLFLLNEIKASGVGNKQITGSERKWVWDVM